MSKKSPDQLSMFDQTSYAEDSPVKTYPSPENVRDWLEDEAACGSSTIELSLKLNRSGLSWKMYPDFFQARKDEILPSSFEGWMTSGIWGSAKLLTANTSEWPSDAAVCSLSDILEPQVDPKYFLSPKACAGILRRAEKRGKELPTTLRHALQAVAAELKEAANQGGKIR